MKRRDFLKLVGCAAVIPSRPANITYLSSGEPRSIYEQLKDTTGWPYEGKIVTGEIGTIGGVRWLHR